MRVTLPVPAIPALPDTASVSTNGVATAATVDDNLTEAPCCHSGDCGYIDCSAITLRDQSLFFNCGYVVPPLNAQYEEVQPDLHSLERYDFSKEPDLPWYP